MKPINASISNIGATLFILFFGAVSIGYTQSRINYNNQQVFLNGSNIAWVNFAGDLGPSPLDTVSFRIVYDSIHTHGGNCLRLWLYTNGTQAPDFSSTDSSVIGPGTKAIADLQKILDMAWQRKISLILCLWSFDMLKQSYGDLYISRNAKMLNDTNYTRAFINNALIPLVSSVKGHPAILAWEVFNEPEGMSSEYGWSGVNRVSMATIQRFINLVAGAIHRTDSTAKVTSGAVSLTTLTDVNGLAKQVDFQTRLSSMTASEKQKIEREFTARHNLKMPAEEILRTFAGPNSNYYRDDRLIAAGGDPDGTLDFYSDHYYEGQGTSLSPFHHLYSAWNLTKPLVIAEFFPEQTFTLPFTALYNTLYENGYAGALSWGWYSGASGHDQETLKKNTLISIQDLFSRYPDQIEINPITGTIYSFTVQPSLIDSGETSVIDWKTALGTTTTLNGNPVAIRGTMSVTSDSTTPYVLIASGSIIDTAIATVKVYPSGTIISFKSSATKIGMGDQAQLRWKVAHGSVVLLNDSVVKRIDSIAIHPSLTTTYTLITTGSVFDTSSIIITVVPADQFNRAFSKLIAVSGSSATQAYANPQNMVDGDLSTQWMSATADNQWMLCDLGQNNPIDRVVIKWGNNYATTYRLSVMSDGGTWHLVRTVIGAVGGTTVDSLNEQGRNIQLWLDTRWSSFTGFGIREFEVYGVPKSVSVKNAEVNIPDRFALFQNYPNPFNPSTTIKFSLPVRSRIIISIFNLLGQPVDEIVNGSMEVGYHSVSWKAIVTSGVYFCRMEAEPLVEPGRHFQQTIKIVLIK